MVIYHIATDADWSSCSSGVYLPAGYTAEGFVHCSGADQVVGTANRLFAARTDLVLLTVEPGRLRSPLVWEDSYGAGVEFPHVYGPIDLEAVVDVDEFPPGDDGGFDWWRAGQD